MNPPEVALAMLERQGKWLLQLRDDVAGIVYPGTWALFGGHLEPGETAMEAVQRGAIGGNQMDLHPARTLVCAKQPPKGGPFLPWFPWGALNGANAPGGSRHGVSQLGRTAQW